MFPSSVGKPRECKKYTDKMGKTILRGHVHYIDWKWQQVGWSAVGIYISSEWEEIYILRKFEDITFWFHLIFL